MTNIAGAILFASVFVAAVAWQGYAAVVCWKGGNPEGDLEDWVYRNGLKVMVWGVALVAALMCWAVWEAR